MLGNVFGLVEKIEVYLTKRTDKHILFFEMNQQKYCLFTIRLLIVI